MTDKEIFNNSYQGAKSRIAATGNVGKYNKSMMSIAGVLTMAALSKLDHLRTAQNTVKSTIPGLMVQAPQMAKRELAKQYLINAGNIDDVAPLLERGALKNSSKWAAGGAAGGAVGGALTKEGAVSPKTLGKHKALMETILGPLAMVGGATALYAGATKGAKALSNRRATKAALNQINSSTLKDTFSGSNRVAAETLHELKPSNTKYLDLMKREQMKHRAAAFGAPAVGGAAIGYGVTS